MNDKDTTTRRNAPESKVPHDGPTEGDVFNAPTLVGRVTDEILALVRSGEDDDPKARGRSKRAGFEASGLDARWDDGDGTPSTSRREGPRSDDATTRVAGDVADRVSESSNETTDEDEVDTTREGGGSKGSSFEVELAREREPSEGRKAPATEWVRAPAARPSRKLSPWLLVPLALLLLALVAFVRTR